MLKTVAVNPLVAVIPWSEREDHVHRPLGTGTCDSCLREDRELILSYDLRTAICAQRESCNRVWGMIVNDLSGPIREHRRNVMAKAEEKKAREKKVREKKECECGCGGETYARFVPGHDARMKSHLYAIIRGEEEKVKNPCPAAEGLTKAQATKVLERNDWPMPAERKAKAAPVKKASKSAKSTKKAGAKASAPADDDAGEGDDEAF